MRKIKFRAWDKAMNWMVYDVQNAYDGMWSDKNTDEINDHYNYVSTMQSFMNEKEFGFMQYTGRVDKNGTEIYEDDLVADECGRIYRVVFKGDCWRCEPVKGYSKNRWISNQLEIVGNVYENSELIE